MADPKDRTGHGRPAEVRQAERRLAEESEGDRDATTPGRARDARGAPTGAPWPEQSPGGKVPPGQRRASREVRPVEGGHGLDEPPPVRREAGEPVPERAPDDEREDGDR